MIVDLDSFEGAEKDFSFEIAPEQLDLSGEGGRLAGSVKVSGTLRKEPRIQVVGSVVGPLELDCTRCLESVEYPLAIDFDDVFLEAPDMASVEERELKKSDLNADVLTGRQMDLLEVAREQILLSLPTQIFCREDCKGLCDRCGTNLNLKTCDCEGEDVDPRWAALKNLKK